MHCKIADKLELTQNTVVFSIHVAFSAILNIVSHCSLNYFTVTVILHSN